MKLIKKTDVVSVVIEDLTNQHAKQIGYHTITNVTSIDTAIQKAISENNNIQKYKGKKLSFYIYIKRINKSFYKKITIN